MEFTWTDLWSFQIQAFIKEMTLVLLNIFATNFLLQIKKTKVATFNMLKFPLTYFHIFSTYNCCKKNVYCKKIREKQKNCKKINYNL